ncbi:MAG: hypothetical protein ABR964_14880 [Tepidisphaeraceae bacterium]|jgi:hypothetical protein
MLQTLTAMFDRLYTWSVGDIKEKAGVFRRRTDNICEFFDSAVKGFGGAKNQYNQPAKRTYFGIYMRSDGWL